MPEKQAIPFRVTCRDRSLLICRDRGVWQWRPKIGMLRPSPSLEIRRLRNIQQKIHATGQPHCAGFIACRRPGSLCRRGRIPRLRPENPSACPRAPARRRCAASACPGAHRRDGDGPGPDPYGDGGAVASQPARQPGADLHLRTLHLRAHGGRGAPGARQPAGVAAAGAVVLPGPGPRAQGAAGAGACPTGTPTGIPLAYWTLEPGQGENALYVTATLTVGGGPERPATPRQVVDHAAGIEQAGPDRTVARLLGAGALVRTPVPKGKADAVDKLLRCLLATGRVRWHSGASWSPVPSAWCAPSATRGPGR